MAIKIECDMCGRLIGELTDIESEGLVFDGYTVEFKDASPSWCKSGMGEYEWDAMKSEYFPSVTKQISCESALSAQGRPAFFAICLTSSFV